MRVVCLWILFPFGLVTFAFVTLPAIAIGLVVLAGYLAWKGVHLLIQEQQR